MNVLERIEPIFRSHFFMKYRIIYILNNINIYLGDENGKYYSDCRRKEPALQAQNDDDAKKLWELSERLTGLNQN